MSMKCKECGKEFDFKNDHIICEDCKTMYFTDKSALQSYLDEIYKSIYDLREVAFMLHQKQLEDSKSLTITENDVIDYEQKYSVLRDELHYFAKNNYNRAKEKEWAEKLYTFNHIADLLIKFYTDKLNSKEDTQ